MMLIDADAFSCGYAGTKEELCSLLEKIETALAVGENTDAD